MRLDVCPTCGLSSLSMGIGETFFPSSTTVSLTCKRCRVPMIRVGPQDRLALRKAERAPTAILSHGYDLRARFHQALIELGDFRDEVVACGDDRLACGEELACARAKVHEGLHWLGDALSSLEGGTQEREKRS